MDNMLVGLMMCLLDCLKDFMTVGKREVRGEAMVYHSFILPKSHIWIRQIVDTTSKTHGKSIYCFAISLR